MSSITRLAAGSNGLAKVGNNNSESGTRIFMFHDKDVRPVFLSQRKSISGIILPGFDSSLSPFDTARPGSVEAYRDENEIDPNTNMPKFTAWFVTAPGYSFYGKGKNNFFSPSAIGQPDPIFDLRMYVYKQRKQGDNSFMYLVDKPANFGDPQWLPGTTPFTMLNVVCPPTNDKEQDQSVKNRILVLKYAATNKLVKDLNEPRPASIPTPLDPEWPNYLLGDVTNPRQAVFFNSCQAKLDTGMEYPGLSFGNTVFVSKTEDRFDCTTAAITEAQLLGRYDLTDTENVVYIPTYDEIVQLLVEEGEIPYDLIMRVCGDKVNNMPAKGSSAVHSAPQPAYSAPAPAVPAPSPAPAPAPAPASRTFWATVNGAVQSVDEDKLKLMVATGFNGAVMLQGESAWKTAADYGIVAQAPAPAPVAPAPMPAPAPQMPAPAPVAPAPAQVPTPAPTQAPMPAVGDSGDIQMRTLEEEERLKMYITRIDQVDNPLLMDEIQEMSRLRSLAPYRA